jgi:5-formyltetrahydrofolate cyclo-ligase
VGEGKRVAHGGKISGMNEISLAKATIRKQILNLRKSGNQSNHALLENLLAVVKMHNPKRVATYISYPTEPDTKVFIQTLLAEGITVLVPETLEDGMLSWHEYLETEEVSLAAGDLLFVPALAVDELGNRLGRGKGYFDREISSLTDVLVYAVVFENEVLDTVPVEAHDQRVDGVVTQEQIRKIN